jgi:hypothetical protein
MLTGKDAVIDDLRERLDREGEERRKLTAILTDQRAKAPEVIVTPAPARNGGDREQSASPPATTKARRWSLFGKRESA